MGRAIILFFRDFTIKLSHTAAGARVAGPVYRAFGGAVNRERWRTIESPSIIPTELAKSTAQLFNCSHALRSTYNIARARS